MNKPCMIHVIDDDEPVRKAFVFALEVVGYRAVDYVDANDYLIRGRMERGVVISDVRMPGMSGVELSRLLRREGSDVPILLMSGHADAELWNDAISAGADLVFEKPVMLTQLVYEIDRITAHWG